MRSRLSDRLQADLDAARSNLGVSSPLATLVDVATVVVGGVMIAFTGSIVFQAIGVVLAIVGLVSIIWRVMQ